VPRHCGEARAVQSRRDPDPRLARTLQSRILVIVCSVEHSAARSH
jgi:hypothetical protein